MYPFLKIRGEIASYIQSTNLEWTHSFSDLDHDIAVLI